MGEREGRTVVVDLDQGGDVDVIVHDQAATPAPIGVDQGMGGDGPSGSRHHEGGERQTVAPSVERGDGIGDVDLEQAMDWEGPPPGPHGVDHETAVAGKRATVDGPGAAWRWVLEGGHIVERVLHPAGPPGP